MVLFFFFISFQCFSFSDKISSSTFTDFSVDFAYPIDGKLAAFLQSTSSVECLARGGGLNLDDIPVSFTMDDESEILSQVSSATTHTQHSAWSNFFAHNQSQVFVFLILSKMYIVFDV